MVLNDDKTLARKRLLGDVATIVLLLLVLFPFAWLVQMSVRPNSDILAYKLTFAPTLAHYRALWTGAFPASFRQQHDHERRLDRSGVAVGGSGVLRAVAGPASKRAQHRVMDSRHPNGAADRLYDPVLPGLPVSGSHGHPYRAHHRLSHLQSRSGDLDDEAILRQCPARTRRVGMDRRLRRLGRLPARDIAAIGARGSRPPR